METRLRTGKTVKLTPVEREKIRVVKIAERFKYESTQMNGYQLIFPCGDREKTKNYELLLKKANELWDDFNIGKQKNKARMMNDSIKARVTQMLKANLGIQGKVNVELAEK